MFGFFTRFTQIQYYIIVLSENSYIYWFSKKMIFTNMKNDILNVCGRFHINISYSDISLCCKQSIGKTFFIKLVAKCFLFILFAYFLSSNLIVLNGTNVSNERFRNSDDFIDGCCFYSF